MKFRYHKIHLGTITNDLAMTFRVIKLKQKCYNMYGELDTCSHGIEYSCRTRSSKRITNASKHVACAG